MESTIFNQSSLSRKVLVLLLGFFGFASWGNALDQTTANALANSILTQSVSQSGNHHFSIVSVPRCGTGELVLGFWTNGGDSRMLVDGFEGDPNLLATAQQNPNIHGLLGRNLYLRSGTLSNVSWSMPYADNFVDLVAATGLSDSDLANVSYTEMERVLVTSGKAWVGGSTSTAALNSWISGTHPLSTGTVFTNQYGTWAVITKISRLPNTYEGNCNITNAGNHFYNDQVATWPTLPQWAAKPYGNMTSNHFTNPDTNTTRMNTFGFLSKICVGGGRMYGFDGPSSGPDLGNACGNGTTLCALRAQSGILLWKRTGLSSYLEGGIQPFSQGVVYDNQIIDGETGITTGTIPFPSSWNGRRSYQVDNDILYAVGCQSDGFTQNRLFPTLIAYDLVNKVTLYSINNFIDNDKISTYSSGYMSAEAALPLLQVVIADGSNGVIYALSQTSVYCYNTKDGSKKWGPVTLPGANCFIQASPKGALIQTGSNFYLFGVADGAIKWGPTAITSGYSDIAKIGSLNNGNEAICAIGTSYAVDLLTGAVCSDRLGNYGPGKCAPGASMMPAGFFARRGGIEFSMANKDTTINSSDPYASECTDAPCAANGMIIYKDKWHNCSCFGFFRGTTAQAPLASILTGTFNPEQPAIQADRLQQGPAYGNVNAQVVPDALDWATHRANINRSGYVPVPVVTSSCVQLWTYHTSTPNNYNYAVSGSDDFFTYQDVTPPVTAGAYSGTSASFTYLAGSDGIVKCLDNATGTLKWSYATGAWVFATPTVANGCVYVGSADGYAYCLEAQTGRLVWKFRAAPSERRFNYYGHLISTWPILTGILVHPNGNAYFASGMMDEYGVQVFALNAQTGAIVWQNTNAGVCLDNRLGLARVGHQPGGYMTVQGPNLLVKEGTRAYGKNLQRIDVYNLLTGTISGQDTSFPKNPVNNGSNFWTGRQIGLMGNYVIGWGEDIVTEMECEQYGGATTFSKFDASGNPVRPFLELGDGLALRGPNLNAIVWDGTEAYWEAFKFELSGSTGLTQYLDDAVANPILSCSTAYLFNAPPTTTDIRWKPVSLSGTDRATALTTNCLVELNSAGSIGVMDRVSGQQLFHLSSGGEPYMQGLAVDRSGKIIVVNRNGDVVCYGTPSPVIVTAPKTVTVTAGQTQTLSVEAAGSGLSYQWRLNGVAIPGGTNATYTIASVSSDTAGDYDVVVTNSYGSTTSAIGTVNSSVVATLTSPVTGACFGEPANIALSASAVSLSGSIAKIDYYQGTTWLGTSSTAPYNFTWSNVPAGSYSLTAVATDAQNFTATSKVVNVVVAGLQVHLPFNQTSGSTAFDTSGHGKNGTLLNNPTWYAQSLFNGGLHFTSGSTAVTLPTLTALSNSSFTVGFWVNYEALDSEQTVLTCKDTVSNQNALIVNRGYAASGILIPEVVWPTTTGTMTSNPYPSAYVPLPLNTWNHFAIVATPSEVDWYVNGSLFAVLTPPSGSTMKTDYKDFIVGNNTRLYDNGFRGIIDELKIYDHAVGAADILAMATTNIPYRSLPQISLLSPANGTVITSTNSVTMSVAVSGSHYPLNVIYCQNGTPILTSTATSYTFTNMSRGTYNLSAQVLDGLNQTVTSSTATVTFTPVTEPTVNLIGGTYLTAQTVTINDTDLSTVLHYTTNGMDPTVNDPVITSGGSLVINKTTMLKVQAFKSGVYPSEIQTVIYRIGSGLAAGNLETVMWSKTGPLWEWGVAANLGAAPPQTSSGKILTPTPFILIGGTNLVTVGPAYQAGTALGLKPDGTVLAWGNGVNGTLGNGTSGAYVSTVSPIQVLGPNGVGVLNNIVDIAVNNNALALKADGTVWAWGNNYSGALGNGGTTNASTPIQVVGPNGAGYLNHVVSIATMPSGGMAIKDDGTLWTWGANSRGQLGNGGTTASYTPVQVLGLSGSVVAIAQNSGFNCLVLMSNGTVWAWGSNNSGQLGNGTIWDSASGSPDVNPYPSQVLGPDGINPLTNVKSIAAGVDFCVALKNDGTVWAWGYNNYGTLGDGIDSTNAPTDVNGDPTDPGSYLPVQVLGPKGVGFLNNVAAIAAGDIHVVASGSDGSIWTWGYNTYGQLGNGTYSTFKIWNNSNTPINLNSTLPFVSLDTAAQTVTETGGPVSITAWLSAPYSKDVTIPFTTGTVANAPYNAIKGTDFTLSTGTLTIPAGQISASMVLTPIQRSIYSATRQFSLNMGTPTNAVLGGITTNTITINDNYISAPVVQFTGTGTTVVESAGSILIPATLSGPSANWGSVPIAVDNTSTAVQGSDFTIPPGTNSFYEGFNAGTTTPVVAQSTLTILNRAGWQGTRTVVLTMGTGASKQTYTVTILDKDPQPVSITNQPAAQTVNCGQPVTFNVGVVGTQPTYQWYRNGTVITGGTGATYTLPSATGGDKGATFNVLVTNGAGSVTSGTVALNVNLQTPASVNITQPSNGAVVLPDPSMQIWVNTWSPGTITKLAYFQDNTKLGETTGATVWNWPNMTSGTYKLTVQATDDQGQTTTSAAVTVTIVKPLTFASWASNNSLNGAMALDTASPAKDGISNLMKYALGLNPNQRSLSVTDGTNPGMPRVAVAGNNLTLLYQKDTTKTDLTYTVETSTDLTTWSTTNVTETEQSINGAIANMIDSVPMGANKKIFIRLKVRH